MTETIWLQRPNGDVPWGFRLQGGRDQQRPLCVHKVSGGSIAETGLNVGDCILMIGETDTSTLTFSQAQELVKSCGNLLQLHIAKGSQDPSAGSQSSQVDMASSGLHDLFQDMYRNSAGVPCGLPDTCEGTYSGYPFSGHTPVPQMAQPHAAPSYIPYSINPPPENITKLTVTKNGYDSGTDMTEPPYSHSPHSSCNSVDGQGYGYESSIRNQPYAVEPARHQIRIPTTGPSYGHQYADRTAPPSRPPPSYSAIENEAVRPGSGWQPSYPYGSVSTTPSAEYKPQPASASLSPSTQNIVPGSPTSNPYSNPSQSHQVREIPIFSKSTPSYKPETPIYSPLPPSQAPGTPPYAPAIPGYAPPMAPYGSSTPAHVSAGQNTPTYMPSTPAYSQQISSHEAEEDYPTYNAYSGSNNPSSVTSSTSELSDFSSPSASTIEHRQLAPSPAEKLELAYQTQPSSSYHEAVQRSSPQARSPLDIPYPRGFYSQRPSEPSSQTQPSSAYQGSHPSPAEMPYTRSLSSGGPPDIIQTQVSNQEDAQIPQAPPPPPPPQMPYMRGFSSGESPEQPVTTGYQDISKPTPPQAPPLPQMPYMSGLSSGGPQQQTPVSSGYQESPLPTPPQAPPLPEMSYTRGLSSEQPPQSYVSSGYQEGSQPTPPQAPPLPNLSYQRSLSSGGPPGPPIQTQLSSGDLDSPLPPPPEEADLFTQGPGSPPQTPQTPGTPHLPPFPPPPPPPPPPLPAPGQPLTKPKSQYPTKLEQQLAGMHVGEGGGYPSYGGGGQQQPNYGGGHHPGAPDYNYQNSYNAAPSQHSPGGYGSPTSAYPPSSGYGSPSSAHSHSSPGYASPTSARPPPGPTSPPAMPDKVINMAARGPPEKKPFAYAPDMDSIKEQRNKVRRRAPAAVLPHYQKFLNMPSFSESPPPGVPNTQPQPQPEPGFRPGPGAADVVHAQYNSPLDMYSQENVAESFAGQTSGIVTGVQGAGNQNASTKGIKESPTWRMIHGLEADAPKPKQPRAPMEGLGRPAREPSADDEITFTGINKPTDIPSKTFHRLQQNIGGSEVDTSSIRQNISGDDEDIGGYDEASIRYRGKNIPSKSFRMLQSMTGGGNELQVPQRARKKKKVPTATLR